MFWGYVTKFLVISLIWLRYWIQRLEIYIFFNSWFHLYGYCLLHIPPPPIPLSSFLPIFPFLSLSSRQKSPLENVTAAILSYAVTHLHEGTEKLRKTCADTVGHLTGSVPSLQSLKKWPRAQRFDMQPVDRRYPIQVLTQRQAAWLGPPGARHLPHMERCRWLEICNDTIFFHHILENDVFWDYVQNLSDEVLFDLKFGFSASKYIEYISSSGKVFDLFFVWLCYFSGRYGSPEMLDYRTSK